MAYSDGEGVNGFVIIDKQARLVAAFWQFAVFVLGEPPARILHLDVPFADLPLQLCIHLRPLPILLWSRRSICRFAYALYLRRSAQLASKDHMSGGGPTEHGNEGEQAPEEAGQAAASKKQNDFVHSVICFSGAHSATD